MKTKMLVMDVDGTLTDGCIYIGSSGEMMKAFHVRDGYAIAQMLPKEGILPVIITGRSSEIVSQRAKELGVVHLYQGVGDKLKKLQEIARELDICPEEIAYIGDDLNDLDCIHNCGISACPSDAAGEVCEAVDFVCSRPGGRAAVREFVEYLLTLN